MKTATVHAHSFDCLPGHVGICRNGSGNNLRVAMHRAIEQIFRAPELRRRHVHEFKMSVCVNSARKDGPK